MPQYPEPEVPYAGYSDLHFATDQQVRSWAALGNYDRGELSVSPRRLSFRGMRVQVDCANVTAVELVTKTFPWGVVLVVGVVAAVVVYLSSPVPFTWRQPPVYLVPTILLIGCAQQWRERWVEVVYSEGERERRVYFRREPIFWGSGAARTRQLHRELREKVLWDGNPKPA
jgi:hypothetical protein